MIGYLQGILGSYQPLSGEGVASLNIEYIVGAVILIMSLWLCFKLLLAFIRALFGVN